MSIMVETTIPCYVWKMLTWLYCESILTYLTNKSKCLYQTKKRSNKDLIYHVYLPNRIFGSYSEQKIILLYAVNTQRPLLFCIDVWVSHNNNIHRDEEQRWVKLNNNEFEKHFPGFQPQVK